MNENLDQLADAASPWPAVAGEMLDFIADELPRLLPEMTPHNVRRIAAALTLRLTTELGGSRPYIPKPDAIRRYLRNLSIWSDHDGTVDGPNGVRLLAKQHKLSEIAVWRILKQQRIQHRADHD